jgi:hypothetical protein
MTPEALALECIRIIQTQPGAEFFVSIGNLKGKGWPRGKLLGSDSRGSFYSYDTYELLGRLAAYGVIRVFALEPGGSALEVVNHSGFSKLSHEATLKVLKVANKVSRTMKPSEGDRP